MPLYGNELDLDTNPYEAGLGRVVKLGKPGDFVGPGGARAGRPRRRRRDAWSGSSSRAAGIARHGHPVLGRRAADRRRHQRHPVADARRADRDGVRRTGRRRAGYRCSMSRSATRGSRHGSYPAVLPEEL